MRPTHISLALAVRAVSLFLLGLPPSFLASRLAALPLDARTEEEELKKKRDCSQSKMRQSRARNSTIIAVKIIINVVLNQASCGA